MKFKNKVLDRVNSRDKVRPRNEIPEEGDWKGKEREREREGRTNLECPHGFFGYLNFPSLFCYNRDSILLRMFKFETNEIYF